MNDFSTNRIGSPSGSCAALALVLVTLACASASAQVVPRPQQRTSSASSAAPSVDEALEVRRVHVADDSLRPQVSVLLEALERLGVGDATFGDAASPLRFEPGKLPGGSTYRIDTESSGVIVVTAATTEGAAHAVATLLQLVTVTRGSARWPTLEIVDGPDHPYRSFMVDMGRNPHSPETLRRVVDMMFFYKANYLHLHLTDDQLFSWPSKAYPKLGSARAGWTWQAFVDLESYSQARGVTIVPEIDVPGHSTILRREYPEVFGKTPTELATRPEAQKGIEVLLTEMASVFRATPYLHVGGDEAYGVREEAQRDFINRLNRHVKSLGKRTVVWEGPSLGQGRSAVDRDVLHMNWRTVNVLAQAMLDAGYDVVNASWDPHYVVDHYPRTMFTAVDVRRCYEWDVRRFAHINHDIATFAKPHRTKSARGILGFCMPWWEGREENLIPLCLPRLAALASAAWNRRGEDSYDAFVERQARALARLAQISDIRLPDLPVGDAAEQAGNVAYRAAVRVSAGGEQPHFGPDRLTNGITDRFDHFLGFPTKPSPLEIVIELAEVARVGRVVVHETAVGSSHEVYELAVSRDGKRYRKVGEATEGSRGDRSFVEHRFDSLPVRFLRIRTEGCHGLTFPSFSRLCEVQAYER